MYTLLVFLGGLFLLICSITFFSLYKAFVLIQLWNWFIIPLLPREVHLTYPIAIGISLIITLLTMHNVKLDDDEEKSDAYKIVKSSITSFFAITFTLFIGWVVHLFM